jgi:putative ABC transport system substrate-binding protein
MEAAEKILGYCVKRRLPSVFSTAEWVVRGGLLAYEPDVKEMDLLAAGYVVKILKGRHPRDLPIEQPTRFRLTVNARTARAIGLTLPGSVITRADKVLE